MTNRWKLLSFTLMGILATGFLIPSALGTHRPGPQEIWDAIDNLQAEISETSSTNEALQEQIDTLEADNAALETKISLLEAEIFPPVDTDLDGILDEEDNCPNSSNADQADANNNGIGNDCDINWQVEMCSADAPDGVIIGWDPVEDMCIYADNDGDEDGYYIIGGGDCNDEDASIHPEAPELADGKDNDCDELVDETAPCPENHARDDTDGDSIFTCEQV